MVVYAEFIARKYWNESVGLNTDTIKELLKEGIRTGGK